MKIIVDAQLPRRLAIWLSEKGFDAIHTLDLPDKNRTSDAEISALSIQEKRIVISKDSDFYDRYFSHLEPYKLIFLTIGNMSSGELISLFELNFNQIANEILHNNVVEVSRSNIITIN